MTLKKKVSSKIAILLLSFFLFSFNSYSQKYYEVMKLEITEHTETVEDYWKPGYVASYDTKEGIIVIHLVEIDKFKVYIPDVKQSKTWRDGTKTITEYYSGNDITGEKYFARVILDEVNDVYLFSLFSEDEDDNRAWHYWCQRKE